MNADNLKQFQIDTHDMRAKYSEINGGSNDVSLKPMFPRASNVTSRPTC